MDRLNDQKLISNHSNIKSDSDWKGWKPIPSIIDDSDLNKLESMIGIELPLSYRYFLKYKHFYHLNIPDFAVNFPTHLPDKNLEVLNKMFCNYFEPELLIEKGIIYFADFQDYGLLCFDSNIKRENIEYPIIYIDHEDLITHHHYHAKNYETIIQSILKLYESEEDLNYEKIYLLLTISGRLRKNNIEEIKRYSLTSRKEKTLRGLIGLTQKQQVDYIENL